jgi:hypothetical protein
MMPRQFSIILPGRLGAKLQNTLSEADAAAQFHVAYQTWLGRRRAAADQEQELRHLIATMRKAGYRELAEQSARQIEAERAARLPA